jgi:hypothetical protein
MLVILLDAPCAGMGAMNLAPLPAHRIAWLMSVVVGHA